MEAFGNECYKPAEQQNWSGRIDGDTAENLRWHQLITCIDLNAEALSFEDHIVFLGFCCDEGVRRNQGRIGSKDSPAALRKVLAGLPNHMKPNTKIADAGDVFCATEDLEAAQNELAKRVAQILDKGGFPVVLGGGHEVTYGHFNGLKSHSKTKNIGVINLDAHFDIRPLVNGQGNSGTGFYQIFEDAKQEGFEARYLALGIQDISNTPGLFNYAKDKGVQVIKREEIFPENIDRLISQIQGFADSSDDIYLTVDMDVFAAAYAPGVSAPAFHGIVPDNNFIKIFQSFLQLPNLKSIDFAEINPLYDIDNRTTKLAADLIFRLVNNKR